MEKSGAQASKSPSQLIAASTPVLTDTQACHRLPRGREDGREGVEDSRARCRGREQIEGQRAVGTCHAALSWSGR